MTLRRITAGWVLLQALALVGFVALNTGAVARQGGATIGDVLIPLLAFVLAVVGLRTARQLWRGEGRGGGIAFLLLVAPALLWLALQTPVGWGLLAVSAVLVLRLTRASPTGRPGPLAP